MFLMLLIGTDVFRGRWEVRAMDFLGMTEGKVLYDDTFQNAGIIYAEDAPDNDTIADWFFGEPPADLQIVTLKGVPHGLTNAQIFGNADVVGYLNGSLMGVTAQS